MRGEGRIVKEPVRQSSQHVVPQQPQCSGMHRSGTEPGPAVAGCFAEMHTALVESASAACNRSRPQPGRPDGETRNIDTIAGYRRKRSRISLSVSSN